jgi:hypothetical protein
LLTLGAGLIAWGIFLLIVSWVLIGESEALRRNPRALLSREVWAEAVISPQGRIAAAGNPLVCLLSNGFCRPQAAVDCYRPKPLLADTAG